MKRHNRSKRFDHSVAIAMLDGAGNELGVVALRSKYGLQDIKIVNRLSEKAARKAGIAYDRVTHFSFALLHADI